MGNWISLSGFKLTLADEQFRPVPHRFVLQWQESTFMRRIISLSDKNFFSFASFEDVNSGILNPRVCVGKL